MKHGGTASGVATIRNADYCPDEKNSKPVSVEDHF